MSDDLRKQMDFKLYFEILGAVDVQSITRADLELTEAIELSGESKLTYQGTPPCLATDVKVVLQQHCEGSETIASLTVEAVSGYTLVQVQFPHIELPGVEVHDRLLVASPWGDCIPNPIKAIAEFCDWQNSQPYHKERVQFIRSGNNEVFYTYPSILAMQYAVIYNEATSFYIACYGLGDETRAFAAGIPGPERLALSFYHYPMLTAETWESPPCSIGRLAGGWHAAADLYASHMRNVFITPDTPGWLRNVFHGWVQIMMLDEHLKPFCRYRDLPEIYQRIEAAGMKVMHVAGWNAPFFDAFYPDFDINPVLGTVEELRTAISVINAYGGRVILYTNGRLIDPSSRFYREGGSDCVCLNKDGEPYFEQYGNQVVLNIACPCCEPYITHFERVIQRLIQEYSANAVQIDQISCTQGYPCYNPTHGHATPVTNFIHGIEHLLQRVRAIHKGLDPEFISWIEGCNERFGQFYDVEQGHGEVGSNWNIGELVPEMFHYTFPERIVTGLSENVQHLCHTFVQGKPFDFYIENLEDPEFRILLSEFLVLRQAHPEYFLRGVFRDCLGIETTGGIRAFRLERSDKDGILVNLWLPGADRVYNGRTFLKHPRPGWRKQLLYPSDLAIVENGDWLTLSWRGPVAVMIFEPLY